MALALEWNPLVIEGYSPHPPLLLGFEGDAVFQFVDMLSKIRTRKENLKAQVKTCARRTCNWHMLFLIYMYIRVWTSAEPAIDWKPILNFRSVLLPSSYEFSFNLLYIHFNCVSGCSLCVSLLWFWLAFFSSFFLKLLFYCFQWLVLLLSPDIKLFAWIT